MNIAQVGAGLIPIPPADYGAVERHIWSVTQELKNMGHEVDILNEVKGNKWYNEFLWARNVNKILKKKSYDAVHVHTSGMGRVISKKHSIIYTSHTPYWIDDRKNFSARWGMSCEKKIAKNAKVFICLTEDIKNKVLPFRKGKKTVVIPNGVNMDVYKPNYEKRVGNRLVALGVVARHKNFHTVVNAIKDMDCHLTIMGIIRDKEYVEELKQKNVTVTGKIDEKEKIRILSESDIFVHPSSSEALSIAVLEAMASGLPVISGTSCKYQVESEKNGFLCENNTEEEYRKYILTMLNDKNPTLDMGKKSRKICNERYSWKNIASQLEEIYKNI